MFAEMFQVWKNTIEASLRPQRVLLEGQPRNQAVMAMPDGSLQMQSIPEPPMEATAAGLNTLVRVTAFGAHPEIWYSKTAVVGFLAPGEIPDNIAMPLTPTERWKLIAGLHQREFDQRSFLKLLRVGLGDASPSSFLAVIRKLIFEKTQRNSSAIQHASASVGKTLTAKMEGEPVPDEIVLVAQMYEEFPHPSEVRCAVDIDLDAEKFAIIPLPMEVVKATERCMNHLAETLRRLISNREVLADQADKIALYFGSY